MKTTCIVLGKGPTVHPNPIELLFCLTPMEEDAAFEWDPINEATPEQYRFIELITKNYGGTKFDLIFCYYHSDCRTDGALFLGRWNDGIV